MQGTILIVDTIATNRISLKVKLASAYYKVAQADDIEQAIAEVGRRPPDLVICALTLPDGTASDLCKELRDRFPSLQLPVLAIGNRDNADSRLAALEAGVGDVLLKPLDDTLLLGRVRSLIRARNAADEWQMRDDTTRALGLAEPAADYAPLGHCVLLHDNSATTLGWAHGLRPRLQARLSLAKPDDAICEIPADGPPDVFVLALPSDPNGATAACRLISALRANAHTRHAGLLVVQLSPNTALAATALDLGADDLMTDGFDAAEMTLRLHALLRRKRTADQLRATVRTGLKAAVFDPLTGLHNRRYAMPHLARIAERAQETDRPFAVMVADLDHFKQINDQFGHAAGDAVLVQTAQRLRDNLRGMDLIARIGGEEFLIVMPGTTMAEGETAAARLCADIAGRGFHVPHSAQPLRVTISIGLAVGPKRGEGQMDSVDRLLAEADRALYSAKVHGRNQVTLSRPAA